MYPAFNGFICLFMVFILYLVAFFIVIVCLTGLCLIFRPLTDSVVPSHLLARVRRERSSLYKHTYKENGLGAREKAENQPEATVFDVHSVYP